MVCVAEFGEPIYPYLKPIDSICNAPDSDLWHTLIEADNYHALQLLEYLYAGKVDCIYIDPPYNTGARDWKINIDHQLQKKSKIGYYIEEIKTESGTRVLPMTADVEECFRKIIANRKPTKAEPMIDGYTGFLYFDKNGRVSYSLHWEHYFNHIVEKYNKIYKVQMPDVTPHVCRHTYCSNMAKSGMNPKTLQYLMGHSDISVTLNVYSHVGFEDAKAEITRLKAM